jgi:hypothetical protein
MGIHIFLQLNCYKLKYSQKKEKKRKEEKVEELLRL